jgi:hypothetical protein
MDMTVKDYFKQFLKILKIQKQVNLLFLWKHYAENKFKSL